MRTCLYFALAVVVVPSALAQSNNERTVDVVSRGVGETADAAKKDAIVNAVQQVVGLYVDAETLVENETIVREKVLTFANADVKTLKVLHSVQEGGLHRVTMKISVVPNSLTKRLRDNSVSVRAIPGETFARLFREQDDKESAGKATDQVVSENLAELLSEHDPVAYWKAEIVGDTKRPKFVRLDEQTARCTVRVQVKPDMAKWAAFRDRVARALAKSDREGVRKNFSVEVPFLFGNGEPIHKSRWFGNYDVALGIPNGAGEWMDSRKRDGHGFVALLGRGAVRADRKSLSLSWDWYRVPLAVVEETERMQEAWAKEKKVGRLKVELIDGDKSVVQASEITLDEAAHTKEIGAIDMLWRTEKTENWKATSVSPFLLSQWHGNSDGGAVYACPDPVEVSLDVPRGDVEKVRAVVAAVATDKRP